MGSRIALVTVLVSLFAVGAGAAWFLSRGPAGGTGRSETAVPAAGSSERAGARPAAGLSSPGALPEEARAAERVEIAGALPAKEELTAAVAAPEGPRLHGRVLDPDGRPIAGATVIAGDGRGFPLDVVGTVPRFLKRAQTETDAEGRYELAGLAAGSLRRLVRAAGFAPSEETDVLVPDAASFELDDVVLQPGALLTGVVVDPSGIGVAGAKLYLESPGDFRMRAFLADGMEPRPAAVTDPAGRFRIDELALGAWNLRVETEDHPERTFEGLAEHVGEIIDRRFELERGDVVAGRVLSVPAAEKGKLTVRATSAQGGEFFGFSRGAQREAKVGPDGEFLVKGLRMDEDYNLQVRKEDESRGFGAFGGSTRSERVSVRSGAQGVELVYQPEAGVTFQVVDGRTEAPVTSFQIQSGFRWRQPFLGDDGRPVNEFPEGRARVGNLRPDASPASLELELNAVGYETYERDDVEVFAGRDTDLGVIRLKPLPLVEVTVLDAKTELPIAGAEVALEEDREEDDRGGFERGFRSRQVSIELDDEHGPVRIDDLGRVADTDEQGIARLTSLQEKRGTVRVTRDGYAPQAVEGVYMPTGETVRLVVQLGLGGAVRVRVVDEAGEPVAGVRVDHRSPQGASDPFAGFFGGRRGEDAVSDAAGELRFDNLEPGLHRFRLHRPERGLRGGRDVTFVMNTGEPDAAGWTEVEVTEGAESEVALVQGELCSVAGRVRESGAELGGATVRIAAEREREEGAFSFPGFGGEEGERTDASGRYELSDLEPGRYVLTVSHPKRRMPADFKLEVKAGENRFDVDLSVAIIEGRITDQLGKPLAGIEVKARKASSGGGGGPRARALIMRADNGSTSGDIITLGDDVGDSTRTDADGHYSLRGVATDVDLVVRASGEGVQQGESEPVTVAPDQVRRGVDLKLEASGDVLVEATTAAGTPAEFVVVRATYQDDVPEGSGSSGGEPQFSFLQSGSTRLSGLRPGRWSVTASPAGPPGGDAPAPEPKEVVVAAGETATVSFSMP
jgi:protocatechuate 3,4-dioxygenase beta subunit